MAGSLVNVYSVGDANLTSLMSTTDKSRIGYHAVSLTHWDDTTVPAIAAGSTIEVNGALYEFATEEALGGSPSDGTVYIKTVPAGASITAVMTNTAPVWDTEKQGAYSSAGGEESYRYLDFMLIKTGAVYYKYQHNFRDKAKPLFYGRTPEGWQPVIYTQQTWTNIIIQSSYDIVGGFNGGLYHYTIKQSGYYLIGMEVHCYAPYVAVSANSTMRVSLQIIKNSTSLTGIKTTTQNTDKPELDYLSNELSCIELCSVGDIIYPKAYVYNTGSYDQAITAWLHIVLI